MFFLSTFEPDNLVSRDRFGRFVLRQPAFFLHSGSILCLLTGFLLRSVKACIFVYPWQQESPTGGSLFKHLIIISDKRAVEKRRERQCRTNQLPQDLLS